MNKTIIININGTVFHIEEDAYEVLKNYMTDVKRHFADAEDSLEITTDIENRIAEMFTEILNAEAKQVIITADVNTVITQMGTVEDFETSAADPDNIYTTHQNFTGNRKLFRDPDDHLISGVCAGIGNYFDIDTVWVRLAFGLAFVLWGSGLLLYIILWIIVPKAITRADKMAMKGEKLDLQGFKKNFEEELKTVQHSVRNAHAEVRPFVYKFRDFISDFFHHLRMFIGGAGRLFLKFFGVMILLMCLGFIIASIVGFICLLVYGNDVYHVFPFSVLNYGYSNILYVGAFALVFIPLLAIALLTIRVIFNGNALGRSTAYTMLIIWVGALTVVIYYSAKISGQFRDEASFSQTITIKPTNNKVYHLRLNDVKFLTREDSLQMNINAKFNGRVILDDRHGDDMMPRNVSIDIVRSDVNQVVLIESFSAKGARYESALKNAQNSIYNFTQRDSVLTFDRRLLLPKGSLWRDQEVELTLKVPYGVTLVIDEDLADMMRRGVNIYDCKQQNNTPDAQTAPFIMTNEGLQCKIDTLPQPVVVPAVK
jgi:phage shock protein PspC (stress-responsive transcriptional regulator)